MPPEAVDAVFLTHVHGDHVLGAVDADGRPTFPNARYLMGRDEWAFWTDEALLQTAPEWAARTARRVLPALAGVMQTVEDGEAIAPGIRAHAAPGHTVGHMAVELASGDGRLLALADTVLHPIHLEHPEWTAVVDQRPEQTVETRRRLLAYAADNAIPVLAFHIWPFPSLGRVVRAETAWAWAVDGSG